METGTVSGNEVGYSELLRVGFISASLSLFFFTFSYAGVVTYLPALYKVLGMPPQRVFGFYMMVIGVASFVMRLIGAGAPIGWARSR